MRNFFEHQADAQRRTRWLLVGMPIAVLGMGVSLFGLLCLVRASPWGRFRIRGEPDPQLWDQLFWSCVLGTAFVVGAASLWRALTLRAGGARVAEMLGGRLVSGQPQDELDRRLLNVIEEIAIAAGVPVPQVFVLDSEPGINALAAGWELHDAAIAVTRGCLEKLSRAELQGVIGHEFSHILHGDMRLNLRLMGTVFGILFVSLLGRQIMQAANLSRRHGAVAWIIGLAVLGIGSVGALFGNLIKAAISRQREFLADASAVQFTRDPNGIASALKKIGGFPNGAYVTGSTAEEASHFFFSDIHSRLLGTSPFATHPPLTERVRRLDPGFRGEFSESATNDGGLQPHDTAVSVVAGFAGQPTAGRRRADSVMPMVGTSSDAAQMASRTWLEQIAAPVRASVDSPYSACALVYAFLLSDEPQIRTMQEASVERLSGKPLQREMQRLAPLLRDVPRADRLALADLAAPALRALVPGQRAMFTRTVQALIDADSAVSIFEYVLGTMLSEHTTGRSTSRSGERRQRPLSGLQREVELLLSLLAHAGDVDGAGARSAFAHAASRLPGLSIALLPAHSRLLSALGPALIELRSLKPSSSAQLVDACAHAILADQRATDDELTLLRAVCLVLGLPVPPLN